MLDLLNFIDRRFKVAFKILRKNCCGLDIHKTWILLPSVFRIRAGSNENMNRIIQRFFPKRTNFDEVTKE